MSKKILLTGGTGFFGKSILDMVKRGILTGYEFTILSRNPEKFLRDFPEFSNLPEVSFIAGDVRSFTVSGTFDAMILGATPSVEVVSDDEMFSIIIDGTAHSLQIARNCGIKKLLFLSSGAVYGRQTVPRVPETAMCVPLNAYGKGKLEAEKMCFDSGIPAVVARCFAFAGKYLERRAHFAFGNFIDDAMHSRDIIIKGDGTPLRSYMHSDDLAEWLMTMLFKGKNRRIYNCGSDESVSIHSLAETIRDELKSSGRIKILGIPDADTPIDCYIPDISRAKRELGLKVTIKLRESINRSAVLSASQSI